MIPDPFIVSVKAKGALGDARKYPDPLKLAHASMTAGSPVVTSNLSTFGAGDIGKTIVVQGAGVGGATFVGVIVSQTSTTAATTNTTASMTVSGKDFVVGTDDTAAIAAAFTDAATQHMGVGFTPGRYIDTGSHTIDDPMFTLSVFGGVRVEAIGSGVDWLWLRGNVNARLNAIPIGGVRLDGWMWADGNGGCNGVEFRHCMSQLNGKAGLAARPGSQSAANNNWDIYGGYYSENGVTAGPTNDGSGIYYRGTSLRYWGPWCPSNRGWGICIDGLGGVGTALCEANGLGGVGTGTNGHRTLHIKDQMVNQGLNQSDTLMNRTGIQIAVGSAAPGGGGELNITGRNGHGVQVYASGENLAGFVKAYGPETDLDLGLVGKGAGHVVLYGSPATNKAVSATAPGSVVRKLEIFNESGTSLGFIPIYDAIT